MTDPLLRWTRSELARAAAASGWALLTAIVASVAVPCVGHVVRHDPPRAIEALLEHLRHGGAWVLLAALGPAIAYPVRALVALRRSAAPAPKLLYLGAGTAALAILSAAHRSDRVRAAVVAELGHPTKLTFEHLTKDACNVALAGAALAFAAALWAAVGVLWARRAGRSTEAAASIASAAVVILAALGAVHAAATFLGAPDGCCGGEPCEFHWYDFFAEALGPLASARSALLVVTGLGTVVILAAARRDGAGAPPSRRALGAGVAVLALGLSAFVATRAAAHDAGNPPARWERYATLGLSAARVARLPAAGRCEHFASCNVLVTWDPDGSFWLDGERMAGQEALKKALAAKVQTWKQVQPRIPFPGIHAAIDADAPLARVGVILDVARAAGIARIAAFEQLAPNASATRTLGDVPYLPRGCWVAIDSERRLPAQGTWGDLVHASE